MSKLLDLHMIDAPHHQILTAVWKYDLRMLRVSWGYENSPDGMLELELSNHENYVCLRFSGLRGLRIPVGELLSSISIGIFDTREIPGAPTAIRVQHPRTKSTEDNWGLLFWADDVTMVHTT